MEQISLYITRFVYTIHSIEVHYKELKNNIRSMRSPPK